MLQGWNRNTDLAVDLKTVLRSDTYMKTGKDYLGVLRRDQDASIEDFRCRDAHYTFVETVHPTTGKRNPHVFNGRYLTVTRRDDGSLRPNFKPMPKLGANLSIDNYAFEVYRELLGALRGLLDEEWPPEISISQYLNYIIALSSLLYILYNLLIIKYIDKYEGCDNSKKNNWDLRFEIAKTSDSINKVIKVLKDNDLRYFFKPAAGA